MIGPAAGVGDERGEPLPVELRDHRRRQLVGDEHERPLEVRRTDRAGRRRRAGSCTAARRRRRRRPCARAGSGPRLVEERRDLVERALRAPTRRSAARSRMIVAARSISIGSSSISSCASKRYACSGAAAVAIRVLDLLRSARASARAPPRAARARARRARRGCGSADRARRVEDQRVADADAGRDADAGQAHDASSKPRSTSARSAAIASRSSGPSAVIVIALPCAARRAAAGP